MCLPKMVIMAGAFSEEFNMDYKLLVVGDGFIGKNLYRYYDKRLQTQLTNRVSLDLCSASSISKYFKQNRNYTHIIYAAGLKDIKRCEEYPGDAFEINAESVRRLLEVFTPKKFIYLSTDYVFDGDEGGYTEASVPNPKTVYGQSKLLGEWYTKIYADNSIIVRTSGVYGEGCPWLKWLISEATRAKKVVCYSDAYNSPTCVDNLAEMILDMIKIDYSGIINLTGPTAVNRYNLYRTVYKNCGFSLEELAPGTSAGSIPGNISLSTELYQKLTHKTPIHIEQGLSLLNFEEKAG